MAMKMASRATMAQKQTARISYRMWMGLNFLRMPIRDLHEEIQRQVETNPALADCKFSLPPGWRPQAAASLTGDNAFLFDNLQAEESLFAHLSRELAYTVAEGSLREKAIEVIGNLDENGRYAGDELDEEGEKARRLVMTLDPLGCGAKSLSECFLAQLEKIPKADRAAAREVILQLDNVLAGKASLSRETQVLASRLLACLDAKPGSHYSVAHTDYIVPDIIVGRDGSVAVEHGTIPEIKVSPAYVNMAGDSTLDQETRTYAQEMLSHVRELQSAVAKRFDTLELVAKAVVDRQHDFLLGQGPLKPLKMKEVAALAKCSLSTVSRTAERKYLRTPRGLVRMRDLFLSKDSSPVEHLKTILADPANAGLSDLKISQLMQAAGFKFARRTVNKYRRMITQ